MVLCSEGIFGVITKAWMRLQDRPVHRGSAAVVFGSTKEAAECCRAISQSGLFPTNCRLLDPLEARNNLSGDGSKAIVVLGFESADHPVGAYSFLGSNSGDLASCLAQWREIKAATNDIVVSNGGTVTHHHAVGRDHRSGYEK